MKENKILITGISGFLGWYLADQLKIRNEVIGIYNTNESGQSGIREIECDIVDIKALDVIFRRENFDQCFHLAAQSKTAYCQTNPKKSYNVNVCGTKNIASLCDKYKVRSVFTSTDQVFDGEKGNYKELDKKKPLNIYGKHKSEAEEIIINSGFSMKIARLPLLVGPQHNKSSSFLQDFLNSTKLDKPMGMFADEYRSIAYAGHIAEGLEWFMSNDLRLLHIAGSRSYSRYEIALRFGEIYNIDKTKILMDYQSNYNFKTPRPKDVSLNIDLARKYGYKISSCFDALESLTKSI